MIMLKNTLMMNMANRSRWSIRRVWACAGMMVLQNHHINEKLSKPKGSLQCASFFLLKLG